MGSGKVGPAGAYPEARGVVAGKVGLVGWVGLEGAELVFLLPFRPTFTSSGSGSTV